MRVHSKEKSTQRNRSLIQTSPLSVTSVIVAFRLQWQGFFGVWWWDNTVDYSELGKVDAGRNYAGGIQLAIWQTSKCQEEIISWTGWARKHCFVRLSVYPSRVKSAVYLQKERKAGARKGGNRSLFICFHFIFPTHHLSVPKSNRYDKAIFLTGTLLYCENPIYCLSDAASVMHSWNWRGLATQR